MAPPCPAAALLSQWEQCDSRGSPVSAPGIVHTWLSPFRACLHIASSPALALLCKRPVCRTCPATASPEPRAALSIPGPNPASLPLPAPREGSWNPTQDIGHEAFLSVLGTCLQIAIVSLPVLILYPLQA